MARSFVSYNKYNEGTQSNSNGKHIYFIRIKKSYFFAYGIDVSLDIYILTLLFVEDLTAYGICYDYSFSLKSNYSKPLIMNPTFHKIYSHLFTDKTYIFTLW